MVSTIDIAWLAGIVEGEGCLALHAGKYPFLKIAMTDKDVIERTGKILKTHVRSYPKSTLKRGKKVPHVTYVSGPTAISWIMTLYPLLGERRKAKAREMIYTWKYKINPRMAA